MRAQTSGERPLEHALTLRDTRAVALNIGQAEGRRELRDVAEHVAEKRFVLFTADAETRLRNHVAERQRPRQLLRSPENVRFDLPEHDLQAGLVIDEMMEQQHHDPAPARHIVRGGNAEQRCLLHVDAVMARIETRRHLLEHAAGRRIDRNLVHHQRRSSPHHLHRLVQPFPHHRRAQNIVTVDHRLKRRDETIEARTAVEPLQRAQEIWIALTREQMVEQNPLLQRRQRINVLHVGRTAGHRRDDPLDLRFRKLHQRQHRRGNRRLAQRDTVGRNRNEPALAPHRLSQTA